MVEFLNSWFLWLFIPLLLIGWVFLKYRGNRKVEFWSIFAVSFVIILALSEPVLKKGEQVIYKKDTEVVILLDKSLSMAVDDIKPSRLAKGLEKALALLELLRDEKVGFVVFSDNVEILLYPREAVGKKLEQLKKLKLKPEGSTDLLKAFSIANSLLTGKERIIILISDGGDEEIDKLKQLVNQSGIRLVFLGTGTEKGGKVPGYNAVSRLNLELKSYVQKNGLFVKITQDSSDIKKIVQTIREISEKTKTVVMKVDKKTYLSPFLAVVGLVIIFVSYASRRFVKAAAVMLFFPYISIAGENLGYLYYAIGKYERAAVEFLEEKNPRNNYNAALSYYKAGEYDKAQQLLKQINTQDIQLNRKIKYTLALCYLAKGKYKEAEKLAEELIELFPQDRKIRKLYQFTSMVLNMESRPELKKTVVRIKEKKSQQFKTSPMEIGDKNPW